MKRVCDDNNDSLLTQVKRPCPGLSKPLETLYAFRRFLRVQFRIVIVALLQYHYDLDLTAVPVLHELVLTMLLGTPAHLRERFGAVWPIFKGDWHYQQLFARFRGLLEFRWAYQDVGTFRDIFFHTGASSVLSHLVFESGCFALFLRFFKNIPFAYYLERVLLYKELAPPASVVDASVEGSFVTALFELTKPSGARLGQRLVSPVISESEYIFVTGFSLLFNYCGDAVAGFCPNEGDDETCYPWTSLVPTFQGGRTVLEVFPYTVRSFPFDCRGSHSPVLSAFDAECYLTIKYVCPP